MRWEAGTGEQGSLRERWPLTKEDNDKTKDHKKNHKNEINLNLKEHKP